MALWCETKQPSWYRPGDVLSAGFTFEPWGGLITVRKQPIQQTGWNSFYSAWRLAPKDGFSMWTGWSRTFMCCCIGTLSSFSFIQSLVILKTWPFLCQTGGKCPHLPESSISPPPCTKLTHNSLCCCLEGCQETHKALARFPITQYKHKTAREKYADWFGTNRNSPGVRAPFGLVWQMKTWQTSQKMLDISHKQKHRSGCF